VNDGACRSGNKNNSVSIPACTAELVVVEKSPQIFVDSLSTATGRLDMRQQTVGRLHQLAICTPRNTPTMGVARESMGASPYHGGRNKNK